MIHDFKKSMLLDLWYRFYGSWCRHTHTKREVPFAVHNMAAKQAETTKGNAVRKDRGLFKLDKKQQLPRISITSLQTRLKAVHSTCASCGVSSRWQSYRGRVGSFTVLTRTMWNSSVTLEKLIDEIWYLAVNKSIKCVATTEKSLAAFYKCLCDSGSCQHGCAGSSHRYQCEFPVLLYKN